MKSKFFCSKTLLHHFLTSHTYPRDSFLFLKNTITKVRSTLSVFFVQLQNSPYKRYFTLVLSYKNQLMIALLVIDPNMKIIQELLRFKLTLGFIVNSLGNFDSRSEVHADANIVKFVVQSSFKEGATILDSFAYCRKEDKNSED